MRLAGVDAPESGQQYWKAAREQLKGLAGSGYSVAGNKAARYQRNVCRVTSPEAQDGGLALVRRGVALRYVQLATERSPAQRKAYSDEEAAARADRIGVLAASSPLFP